MLRKKNHIAVLDDDHSMTSLLDDFLSRSGYAVTQLKTSRAALDLMSQGDPSRIPDLLISDVKMKPIDGLEMTRLILSKNPRFPIILFTVYDAAGLMSGALEVGARRLLKKPFPLADLAAAIFEELAKQ